MSVGRTVALVAGALIVSALAFAVWFVRQVDGIWVLDTIDQTSRWQSFYRDSMKPVVELPSDAKVVSATTKRGARA